MTGYSAVFASAPWRYSSSSNSVTLALWVKPGARRDALCGLFEGKLALQISAVARDGEANDRVIEYLAQVFGLKRRVLSVHSGHKSREKVVQIALGDLEEDKILELPVLLSSALEADL